MLRTLRLTLSLSKRGQSSFNMAAQAFRSSELVPDVLPVPPEQVLKVKFSPDAEVNLGNELTPTAVKSAPTAVSWSADPAALYTLVLTDPDAPSRAKPSVREFLHWLVVNIPGDKVAEGDVQAEYVGSGPPQDTGLHRYAYLVWQQSGKLSELGPQLSSRSAEGRRNWSAKAFAEKNGLGTPLAGNFYEAQYDSYVPELHKQLSGK